MSDILTSINKDNIIDFIKGIFICNRRDLHAHIAELGDALLSSFEEITTYPKVEDYLHLLDRDVRDDYGLQFIYEELETGKLDALLALFGMLQMIHYQAVPVYEICADDGVISIDSDTCRKRYTIRDDDKIVYAAIDGSGIRYDTWNAFITEKLIPEFLEESEYVNPSNNYYVMCAAYAIIVALEISRKYDNIPLVRHGLVRSTSFP